MKKSIQIRSVSEGIHKKLKTKAAKAGLSLTDFLKQELELLAQRPSIAEVAERILSRKPVRTKMSPTNVLRIERNRS